MGKMIHINKTSQEYFDKYQSFFLFCSYTRQLSQKQNANMRKSST